MQSRPDTYQFVLNIQTTGLMPENGHRIIEVACIKLKNETDTCEYVQLYINPEGKQSDPDALAHHCISDDLLKDKPLFAQVAHELIFFMRPVGAVTLVMHNAEFVKKFLALEMKKAGKLDEWNTFLSSVTIVDTWVMARKLHPQHNKLQELAEEYKVNSLDIDAAMYKADLLAKLYPALKQHYDARMEQTSKAVVANSGLFSASAKAAANPAAKRYARKNVTGPKK